MQKYGLLSYKTENLGDEIQSIAARRFLPRIDYYFDRDDIDATKIKAGDKVKLIMNGWYTHRPENWPPKNPAIEPLLVAMHVEQDALEGRPKEAFLSEKSQEFLKKYGPIGARNLPTLELLKSSGIDSYFSGCLTLTLLPDKSVKKRDFILAVDVSDEVFSEMKKRTKREIIRLDAYRIRSLSQEQKIALAEYWLSLYQSAHAVVTTRLHCMLPCLALGTPVLAISGNDPKRYAGLIELTNNATEAEFLKNSSLFNLDQPRPNPENFKKLAKEIAKSCSKFTGHDSKKSYLGDKDIDALYASTDFIGLIGELSREAYKTERMEQEIIALKTPGIKMASRKLAEAVKRKFN